MYPYWSRDTLSFDINKVTLVASLLTHLLFLSSFFLLFFLPFGTFHVFISSSFVTARSLSAFTHSAPMPLPAMERAPPRAMLHQGVDRHQRSLTSIEPSIIAISLISDMLPHILDVEDERPR